MLYAITATDQVLCVGFQASDDMNRLLGVFHLHQKAMMHKKHDEHYDDEDGIPPLYQHNLQQQ